LILTSVSGRSVMGMRCPKCFHRSVHKKLTSTERIEVASGVTVEVVVNKCHCDYCGHEYLDDEAHAEIIQMVMRARHREKLADYAHEAWSGWMKYLFGKCVENSDGEVTIPAWAVQRWQRQMNTAYADLPYEERKSDQNEADKMLAIMEDK